MSFEDRAVGLESLELTVGEFISLPQTAALLDPDEVASQQVPEGHFFALLEKLGEGAMGSVHLVRDGHLERNVAYKQLLAQWRSPELTQRFLSEVQITAQLAHPNIVPVYSLEMTAEGIGYTMKRVAGQTFKELIQQAQAQVAAGQPRKAPVDLDTLLEHFLKVCDALAYAHYRGVIHRDLKPANLMVGAHNEVYVMDWGIARPFGQAAEGYVFEQEELGKMVGTPRYMSPEQARGANSRLDARSDLFALGLILSELISLRPAYQAGSAPELLAKVRQAQITPLAPHFPRELRAIVSKATAWKRAERYASVAELAADLRRYRADQAVAVAPDRPQDALLRWVRRHRTACLGLLFALVLLSSAVTLGALVQQQRELALAQRREAALTAFWGEVLGQGQEVDRYMLSVLRMIESLAGTGIQALQRGTPSQERYYLDDARWNDLVPNLVQSPLYNARVSLDYSGFTLATGLTEPTLRPQLQRLIPLRRYFRNLLVRSAGRPVNDEVQLLAQDGAPAMFVNLSTEQGVIQSFPGISYNTPNYDPRKRPFYKLVLGKRGVHCGNPYLDRVAGSLLPCSLALYDAADRFLGVASLDIQFNYLARHVLDLSASSAWREAYLVDHTGQVIVKASDRHRKVEKQQTLHTGFTLAPFPDAALLQRIRSQHEGGYLERPGQVLGYIRLNFQGWYFVVAANPQTLLGTP